MQRLTGHVSVIRMTNRRRRYMRRAVKITSRCLGHRSKIVRKLNYTMTLIEYASQCFSLTMQRRRQTESIERRFAHVDNRLKSRCHREN